MSKIFVILSLFVIISLVSSQQPRRFDSSSNRRNRTDLLSDLEKFREQQRKFLEENTLFNSSGFFRGGLPSGKGNFSFPQGAEDLEERLNKLRGSIPQSLGIKCYADKDGCKTEGGCVDDSDCIPCMNWDTRKPGFRCLKSQAETETP